jgi:hypothetical protein
MRIRNIFMLVILGFFFSACASTGSLKLNAAKKTSELRPGMSYPEVIRILGEPKSSIFTEDEWQVNYSLHEYWKGWVPYVLVFDKNTLKLKSWKADEEAYQRNQVKWMQILNSLNQQPSGAGGGQGGASSGGSYGGTTVVPPTADFGSYEPSQFELDSQGYPGGAYENPSSTYYDSSYY